MRMIVFILFISITQLVALDMSHLRVNLHNAGSFELGNVRPKILHKLFHRIFVDTKQKKVLAVCSTGKWDKQCVWKNGKGTIDFSNLIQPIKGKDFYIFFGGFGVGAINLDSGFYSKLIGKLIALQDLDGDKLPEIITIDDRSYAHRKLYAYKILDIDKQPSIGQFASNPVLPQARVETPKCSSDCSFDEPGTFEYTRIIYDKEEGLLLPKFKKENFRRCEDACKKGMKKYFAKWSATPISMLSSWKRLRHDSVMHTAKGMKINELDMLHLDKYMTQHSICYRIDKIFKGKNLMLCEKGHGVYHSPKRNFTAVMDLGNDRRGVHYVKKKIKGQKVAFFASNRYLIIEEIKSHKTRVFQWKKLLGYDPLMVSYCDGETVVVVQGSTKENKKVNIYNLDYSTTNVAEESW